MRRGASNHQQYVPRPVQRLELSDKNLKLRIVAFVIVFLIAGVSISYGVLNLFNEEAGWESVEPVTSERSCAGDFVLLYHFGTTDLSPRAESKLVTGIYSQALVKAYQLFTDAESFEDVHNVRYLNEHINETVEVDPVLYHALEQVVDSGDRSIYLAPAYTRYDDLFACTADSQTADFDPLVSSEVAAEYGKLADFVKDPDAVDLRLLGENKVMLSVSEEYRQFQNREEYETYLDFMWLKNAFIADFLADTLIEAGYTHGTLSSFDGYYRNFSGEEEDFALNLYDRVGEKVFAAGTMLYNGPSSLVYLRDHVVNSLDKARFYVYENGEHRGPYLSVADGTPKAAKSDLVCYSETSGCADVLLQMIPLYVTETFDSSAFGALSQKGVFTVYCEDSVIYHNDSNVTFKNLYQDESTTYSESVF